MTHRTKQDQGPRALPTFANEKEAADFWDTHSPLDFPDQFEEAEVSFAKPLLKGLLTITLAPSAIEALRGVAREQGVGPSTLARTWVLERLRREGGPSPSR